MKRNIAIVLLVGFISIGVFGFFGMHRGNSHMERCIAVSLGVSGCPSEGNPLAFAAFHLKALSSFWSAMAKNAEMAITALLLVAGAMMGYAWQKRIEPLAVSLGLPIGFPQKESKRAARPLLAWLAFHETSPTAR